MLSGDAPTIGAVKKMCAFEQGVCLRCWNKANAYAYQQC